MSSDLTFVRARPDHLPRFEQIRAAAFAPVFASFKRLLGDEIYALAQAPDDAAQPALLVSLATDPRWELYAAERGGAVVGFMAVRLDHDRKLGEIGLNAVDPAHAGQGVGTAMYEFAIERMRQAGIEVATVATGNDASHAPARRAYEKAGFNAQVPSVWMCRLI
jgi:ribosomal protein S18 acetylase RimI-like enzyme